MNKNTTRFARAAKWGARAASGFTTAPRARAIIACKAIYPKPPALRCNIERREMGVAGIED